MNRPNTNNKKDQIEIDDQTAEDPTALATQNQGRVGHVCPFLSREHIQRGLQTGRYTMTGIGLERRCTRCKEYWPADTEFFYFQPSACGGLNCYCHDCYRSVTGRQPGQRRNIRQEEMA